MVTYIKSGDIFALPNVTSFAHGCNCAGAMGAGIAVQFKNKFPEMYLQYKQMCKEGKYLPGDVFDYNYGGGHIYNLGTQETWRIGAKLEYIESSLTKMMALAKQAGVDAIAMPAIGAGLGGLRWEDVKAVIDNVCAELADVEVFVVETYSKN